MQVHQSNYRRILHLRATTAGLDTQIKDTLRLLANTRKELVSARATVFPSDVPTYDINYDEMLAYGRRISKTTMPPAISTPIEIQTESNGGAETTAATTPASGTPNGASTPANGTQQQQHDPTTSQAQQQQAGATPAVSLSTNTANLPEDIQWHLNPQAGLEFIPWPNEDQVRKGALASLAFISEQGIDAENYDPEQEKLRKEREEEEKREAEEREERERRAREEQARARAEREREREQSEAWRRGSVTTAIGGVAGAAGAAGAGAAGGSTVTGGAISASPTGEKKQFQFMADDDDDDDDE